MLKIILVILIVNFSFLSAQQEKIIEVKPSREAKFVEVGKDNVYKVYARKDQALKSMDLFKQAKNKNIPVVTASLVENWKDNTGAKTFAIKMKKFNAPFFQLSQTGKDTAFFNQIKKDNNKENAKKVIRTLLLAYDSGMTDPQFFYTYPLTAGIPITFIDPHFRSGKGPEVLKALANKIKTEFKL